METTTDVMPPNSMDAWSVAPGSFPAQAALREQLSFLLHYAILAPSINNAQPWLFAISDAGVDLFADRTRALPVVDPDDRELTISCGAALFNLRIAMRKFGYRDVVELFPDPGDSDLLARVVVRPDWIPTSEDQLLFDAIPRRHTNRHPFEERAVSPALVVALQGAADDEGAWLHVIESPSARRTVVDLVRGAELMLWEDRRYRRELASWLHPRRHGRGEGIPGSSPGLADLVSFLGSEDAQDEPEAPQAAAQPETREGSSALLVVLGTAGDAPDDWLAAGQAMERVLLRAQADGVSASFLNQAVEVREMRPRLRNAVGEHGFPQLLLRLGYGPQVSPAPRRPVREVILS